MLKKLNTDKTLFILLFLTISMVIISQIGLVFPKTRDAFTDISSLEGTNYKDGDIKKGTVSLILADGELNANLEILINGEKVDVFDKKTKEIEIIDTSVIEVYAYDLERPLSVVVEKISKNILDTTKNKEIHIDNGYNIIGRYMIEN